MTALTGSHPGQRDTGGAAKGWRYGCRQGRVSLSSVLPKAGCVAPVHRPLALVARFLVKQFKKAFRRSRKIDRSSSARVTLILPACSIQPKATGDTFKEGAVGRSSAVSWVVLFTAFAADTTPWRVALMWQPPSGKRRRRPRYGASGIQTHLQQAQQRWPLTRPTRFSERGVRPHLPLAACHHRPGTTPASLG